MVKGCHQCQVNCKSSAPAPWESPTRPWARLHIDHAGKQFVVLVDAYSKWLEVVPVPSLTSETTIRTLRGIFATHGLPELIVSDNGSLFTSGEFYEFVQRNGIRHVKCSPYHPASNGQAERAVQTFKEGLKKPLKETWHSSGMILVPIQTNTTLNCTSRTLVKMSASFTLRSTSSTTGISSCRKSTSESRSRSKSQTQRICTRGQSVCQELWQ